MAGGDGRWHDVSCWMEVAIGPDQTWRSLADHVADNYPLGSQAWKSTGVGLVFQGGVPTTLTHPTLPSPSTDIHPKPDTTRAPTK